MKDISKFLPDLGLQGDSAIALQVFVVVFITLLINFIVLRLLAQVVKHIQKTHNFWDDILILSARKPLSFLIWIIGLSWAVDLVAASSDAVIFDAVGSVREMAVIVLLAWFIVGFIRRTEEALVSPDHVDEPLDKTTVTAIGKLLRISIIITATLVMLQTLGYSISGVLAFGGIGGIAIGFAAKDLLANFFGGLMVYLDRPFSEGDWIRSPDRNIEGTVESIGWRLTRIRTFDKRPLYVPNATFTSITVENPSRMTNRRINETIGLRYQDAGKLEQIIKDVESMLHGHPDIDTNNTLMVNFNAYGPSSLDFFIYTFTKTTDWATYHSVKQDVLMKILSIIGEHGADVAFPTSTLHVPEPIEMQPVTQLKTATENVK